MGSYRPPYKVLDRKTKNSQNSGRVLIDFILKINREASSKTRRCKKREKDGKSIFEHSWLPPPKLLLPLLYVLQLPSHEACGHRQIFFVMTNAGGCPLQTFFPQSAIHPKNGGELHWRPFVNSSRVLYFLGKTST